MGQASYIAYSFVGDLEGGHVASVNPQAVHLPKAAVRQEDPWIKASLLRSEARATELLIPEPFEP